MEEYRFEHKEPLTQRVVLALRVNTKQLKEQLWLGTEYEVEAALRGLDKPLYLAQTRPLGAFWCEFGETSADGLDGGCVDPFRGTVGAESSGAHCR